MAEVRWRLLVPASIRRLPADLAAVVAVVALTVVVVFTPGLRETPVRVVVTLPFVLFLPGYALVAALFPEGNTDRDGARTDDGGIARGSGADDGGIDGLERLALSIGGSIVVVPLVGLTLNYTPVGLRLEPIVVTVGVLTLATTAVAARRRRELPSERRYHVPHRRWLAAVRDGVFEPSSRADLALTLLLVTSVLVAAGSVGHAVAAPKGGESFTELYLLTDDDGDLVARGYPQTLVRGESTELYLGIDNHEHDRLTYTVVVELHRVAFEDEAARVVESQSLGRLQSRLGHDETARIRHEVTPRLDGERLRLTYLLYRDTVPDDPAVGNAYREVHLWVNVTVPPTGSVGSP